MKHTNQFKQNVRPQSEYSARQWTWNFLRKQKRKLGLSRKNFIEAALGVRLLTRNERGRVVPKHASGP